MRIRKNKFLLVLVLPVVASIGFALYAIKSREATTLVTVLHEYDCQQPCWYGIELGITKQATVRQILADRNIVYKVATGPAGEENGVYEWNERFGATQVPVAAAFSNGIVQQITVVTDFCISYLIETFGTPSTVKQNGDYFYLLYPDEGKVFSIHPSVDSRHASLLFLVSEAVYEVNFDPIRASHQWSKVASNFQDSCRGSDTTPEA